MVETQRCDLICRHDDFIFVIQLTLFSVRTVFTPLAREIFIPLKSYIFRKQNSCNVEGSL